MDGGWAWTLRFARLEYMSNSSNRLLWAVCLGPPKKAGIPEEVYSQGRQVTIPKWQGCARAAKTSTRCWSWQRDAAIPRYGEPVWGPSSLRRCPDARVPGSEEKQGVASRPVFAPQQPSPASVAPSLFRLRCCFERITLNHRSCRNRLAQKRLQEFHLNCEPRHGG